MGIFKGQGKSGVTASMTDKTIGKNASFGGGANQAMTAMGITKNGRCPDGETQMGSAAPFYKPTAMKDPEYNGSMKHRS